MTNKELQVKHTPAPWHFVHNSWDISTIYGSDDTVIALTPIGDLTCDEDQESFEPVKDANARLIAAAPELLEALKQCFDYPKDVFEITGSESFTMTVTGRHLQMVKSAIKKAEGKA